MTQIKLTSLQLSPVLVSGPLMVHGKTVLELDLQGADEEATSWQYCGAVAQATAEMLIVDQVTGMFELTVKGTLVSPDGRRPRLTANISKEVLGCSCV